MILVSSLQEVAICSNCRRTATVKSKNYCVTAKLSRKDFNEVVERFPDLYERLKDHSRRYRDDQKKQLKEAIMRTSYIAKLSDEIIEEMLYTLRQEQFENGNTIFREGDMCKGIILVMDGGIDLTCTENGKSIAIDTLGPGSSLFSYSCLAEEGITLTGVAVGKTTILVLPYETLEASRSVNIEFDDELEEIEEYISKNGVPQCDYTQYRSQTLPPIE